MRNFPLPFLKSVSHQMNTWLVPILSRLNLFVQNVFDVIVEWMEIAERNYRHFIFYKFSWISWSGNQVLVLLQRRHRVPLKVNMTLLSLELITQFLLLLLPPLLPLLQLRIRLRKYKNNSNTFFVIGFVFTILHNLPYIFDQFFF